MRRGVRRRVPVRETSQVDGGPDDVGGGRMIRMRLIAMMREDKAWPELAKNGGNGRPARERVRQVAIAEVQLAAVAQAEFQRCRRGFGGAFLRGAARGTFAAGQVHDARRIAERCKAQQGAYRMEFDIIRVCPDREDIHPVGGHGHAVLLPVTPMGVDDRGRVNGAMPKRET